MLDFLAQLSGKQQTLHGAEFTITGDVVEFGRKETGDAQLFGILGEGYVRVSYANSTENILKALDRMGEFLSSRKAA